MSSLLRMHNLRPCVKLAKQSLVLSRSFVKVGDDVPVNYIKDAKNPKIKADGEYPPWVLTLATPGKTKTQLLDLFNKVGTDGMTAYDIKRLKKFLILDKIRTHNAATAKGK